ncbi:PP2C family protein-serine/threonine phosphatase [Albimonas pacifica]|uniref:Protein phosphatase/serine/threonine protein phosphatase Stp1 n=1 Tax=Albimonas pacifica TaxID=1114924 RepID=A0A1I3CZY2_9RHOB|nr:protein phosphatase 2C domain-containing protein [Albimonas pacifica]SFH80027.1 protein phosphatase/serine/threonine protein phosphatase Stp1 [Albimonas pacifica]
MTDISPARPRRSSARTHVGRVREVNEDAILSMPRPGFWAVSDGMGGHDAGDFASRTVVEALGALSPDLAPAEVMHEAREAVQEAHRRIGAESARRGGAVIGATVVILVLAGEHFLCLWAGDSRLYRLRGGRLEMLSIDHSVVGELVERGELTLAEAEHHPRANQITRAVGVGARLEIDKRRGEVLPGDRFLLCSDGLTRHVDEAALAAALREAPVETAAGALVERALAGGGADNISAIVVEA